MERLAKFAISSWYIYSDQLLTVVYLFFMQVKRTGRLKVYKNLYEEFAREMSLPCVIVAGHPSLRFGHIVHFLELWGDDPKNAIILTGWFKMQATLHRFSFPWLLQLGFLLTKSQRHFLYFKR